MDKYAHLKIDGTPLTDQEKFVIGQAVKGEEADLVLEFGPNARIRQLRSIFLEKLLTEGFYKLKIHRVGIKIKNAVFKETLNLENAIISHFVNLRYCIFANKVIFRGTHFEKLLSVTGSIFLNEANFHRIRVGMSFFIRHTIFEQSVNFGVASIGRNLECRGACFNNKVGFNSMKAGSVNFIDTMFNGFVDLVYLRASNMFLRGTKEKFLKIEKMALRNASFERELEFRFVEINLLNLKDIQIKGPLNLNNVQIIDKIDLSYANLYNFKMEKVQFPKEKDSVILDGLVYKSISAGEEKDDWKKLIELVEVSKFNIQNYSRLEAFYKESGELEKTNEVYIRGKRRELSNQEWWNPKKWATWILWDKLTNYGRKPGRTIWISLFIIIIGAFFFDPKILKPEMLSCCSWLSHGSFYQDAIMRLILSFNHFLPAIDMGLTKELQFSNMSFHTFLYFQIHKICGWILIPIGLAAIYTRIK